MFYDVFPRNNNVFWHPFVVLDPLRLHDAIFQCCEPHMRRTFFDASRTEPEHCVGLQGLPPPVGLDDAQLAVWHRDGSFLTQLQVLGEADPTLTRPWSSTEKPWLCPGRQCLA